MMCLIKGYNLNSHLELLHFVVSMHLSKHDSNVATYNMNHSQIKLGDSQVILHVLLLQLLYIEHIPTVVVYLY